MDRIESLLRAMTLTEKLGQLNLVSADRTITGPAASTDIQGKG